MRFCIIFHALILSMLIPFSVLADTTVTFIEVGQGDAIWIHDDTGHDVLIDAGESDQGAMVLQYLQDVPELDVLLWTHAHADHTGGLFSCLLPLRHAVLNECTTTAILVDASSNPVLNSSKLATNFSYT